MPHIIQYRCENYEKCHFGIIDTGPTMNVRLEDGTIEKLPHPSEEARALAVTGKSLGELAEEKRIFYQESKFCTRCLKVAEECVCQDTAAHIPMSELEGKKCFVCKTGIIKKSAVGMS